jgi:hypothetical protein
MNETLRQFVERRLQELQDEERPLRERLDEIVTERRELEKTIKLIGADGLVNNAMERRESQEKTIKEAVLDILSAKPNGLTATEILRDLNLNKDRRYARTSLSPQLSRLKRDGKVRQSGIVWSLANIKADDSKS